MKIEDKAYFDRRIYHSTGTFHTLLDKETRVPIDGTSKFVTVDPAQYITPRRVRITGIKGEIEIAAQLSGDEIKGISAKAVKATAARQGIKAKFAKAIETLYSNWIITEKMGVQYVNGGNGSVKEAIEDAKRWIDIWSKKYDFGKLTVNIYKVDNKISKLIKTIKFARQGSKAKFYLDPSNIPLILKQEENENRKVLQLVKQKQASGKKSDLMDATGLAHGMAYSNATANTIQDLRKISKSKNPADKQAAQQALSKIEAIESFWQAKHTELQSQLRAAHSRQGSKAKFAFVSPKYEREDSWLAKITDKAERAYTTISQLRERLHNLQNMLQRTPPGTARTELEAYYKTQIQAMSNAKKEYEQSIKHSRTGTKSKFANRGAFAEASSSPVLGSLLEKKVMPEGGWRAVETDGGALVIAFEDGDIAGNFARRASENGYSATAPIAMAGRFWNVKVQNENNK